VLVLAGAEGVEDDDGGIGIEDEDIKDDAI
jgi:hypothetical protein